MGNYSPAVSVFAVPAGKAAENLKAFPQPRREWFDNPAAPRQADESAFKVELIVGKRDLCSGLRGAFRKAVRVLAALPSEGH